MLSPYIHNNICSYKQTCAAAAYRAPTHQRREPLAVRRHVSIYIYIYIRTHILIYVCFPFPLYVGILHM